MGLKGELFHWIFIFLFLFVENILEWIGTGKQPLHHSIPFFLFVCCKVAHTTKMWSDKKFCNLGLLYAWLNNTASNSANLGYWVSQILSSAKLERGSLGDVFHLNLCTCRFCSSLVSEIKIYGIAQVFTQQSDCLSLLRTETIGICHHSREFPCLTLLHLFSPWLSLDSIICNLLNFILQGLLNLC